MGGGIVVYDKEQKKWGSQTYDSDWVELFSTAKEARGHTDNMYQEQGDFFPVSSISISEDMLEKEYLDGTMGEYASKNKYAYATINKLTTDFIFDGIDGNSVTKTPAVCVNGKWGFINDKGEQIISYKFEGAVSIDDNKAFVKLDGKWGVINKK